MRNVRVRIAAALLLVTVTAIPAFAATGGSNQQTITFDDAPVANAVLNGQYPAGVINWGSGVWFANIGQGFFKTPNLKLNGTAARTGTFTFVVPRRVVSLSVLNRSSPNTTVFLTCAGQPRASVIAEPWTIETLTTNWTANCSSVTLSVGNGATLFDNLVIDDAGSTTTTSSSTSSTSSTTSSTTSTTTRSAPPYWIPPADTSWDWQLATPVNQSANVTMYDIDAFDNAASVMASLHAQGRKVICYIDVGSWEDYRSDAGSFPASVKGATYSGFPDEKWLDIRQWNILGPIMTARFNMAKSKGCDGIEPDNVDGYDVDSHGSSGFPLTYNDQIVYNKHIADLAHSLDMSVGLKNDINQVADLVSSFDWALSEQCFQYGECGYFAPFSKAGKAVFEVEYQLATTAFCPQANALNFNALRKHDALDSYRVACR